MGDRDIPSVPVTTLAGLTSLSDLLSELPISDSLPFLTLNKSLLFHPRVAEEANNLLSVRDDALVTQLVNAIEQTNSDHIELKDQYSDSTIKTPTTDSPQLLQAIQTFKANVFNSQIINNSKNIPSSSQNLEQQQQQSTHHSNLLFATPSDSLSYAQQSQQHHIYNQFPNNTQQQPPPPQPQLFSHTQQQFNSNNNVQQFQQNHQFNNFEQSSSTIQQNQFSNLVVSGNNNQTIFNQVDLQNQQPLQQHSSIIQVQGVINSPTQSYIPQQQPGQMINYLPNDNQHMQNQAFNNNMIMNNQLNQGNSNIAINNYHLMNQSNENVVMQSQQEQLQYQLKTEQEHNEQQQLTNNQLNLLNMPYDPMVGADQHNFPQTIPSSTVLCNSVVDESSLLQNHQINDNILSHQQQTQKIAPRNNEYLQQQNSLNMQVSSPSQASVAPECSQMNTSINHSLPFEDLHISTSAVSKTAEVNPHREIKALSVTLQKLTPEVINSLQQDLRKFVDDEPKLAAKLGVEKKEESRSSVFSQMKASETRTSSSYASKRKLLNKESEKPEELFSKPKLRRVEKKVVPTVQKLSKEELMKTNTYQRFISFMDRIFDLLDETDQPISMEEENFECIPSRLLSDIAAEAAKLKARSAIDSVPENRLTLLISYAMRSIHLAKNFSAGPDMQEDLVAEECIEKIFNAFDASLLVLIIYTSKTIKFLQEDNIDTILKFIQFQLRETIFPSYDPVYTVETKKKVDGKKSKKVANANNIQKKKITSLYTKIVEITKILVTLFNKFHFVDTIIIHASALGVEPFFVDNIEALQFVCLDLVTSIFQNEKYSLHRRNILNDILSSVDRLPHSKRNLRPYKLTNNGGNIQMMTALVLQLIQSSVVLPDTLCDEIVSKRKHNSDSKPKTEKDVFILDKYDTALSVGGNFLTTFLNKCKTRSSETDFRPLFENFIHDLLTTVNKPEWPASELLLSLLGTLLVNYMADKSIEQPIRVVSLEYLGIVAAKLRKDTVESRCKVKTMDQLIKYIKIEQEKEGDKMDNDSIVQLDPEEERTEFLQKILLDYLAVNAQEDDIVWNHARHYYLTQWYRDLMKRKKLINEGEKGYASRKKNPKKRKKYKVHSSDTEESDGGNSDGEEINNRKSSAVDQELNSEIFRMLEERKKYFLSQITAYSKDNITNIANTDIKTYIDYSNANLIAQYLASKRSFSQSFDRYLQKIILVVREPVVAIRTKAMKCLGNIVEVDQSILTRKDMQMGVQQKLLDTAISVREAAVDLVGKYILTDSELIDQYYDMISQRILDTGVSVRKRVIKILRDICLEYPEHDKVPDICVKMIRRVNDEEGIQKLVMEVFMSMWFTPCADNDKAAMGRKIIQIMDVVCSSQETGTQGLDALLKTIFEPKENKEDTKLKKEIPKSLIKSCQQIVDGLVDSTIQYEGTENKRTVGCISALHLFAKIRPQLLVNHAMTLEPYLNIKSNSATISKFISSVAEILEQVVPLMEHPSESFLADIELHLMILIMSHNQAVVTSCVSCLAAIVNKISKNYKLIRECFSKFYYKSLVWSKEKLIARPDYPTEQIYKPLFRRSIFTVGLIMRYFDFSQPEVYGANDNEREKLPATICNEVFQTLSFFLNCANFIIRKETLVSIGYFCVKNFEYLAKAELSNFYHYLLTQDTVQNDMKINVLRNILIYLTEEEQKMVRNDKDWTTLSKTEDLKEMGDVSSGMASKVIQIYLKEILNSFLNADFAVRLWAMRVVEIVLRQGLVHPVQIVPYLICLSSDPEKEVAHCADHHLQEIEKQYPGFVNMKSQAGMHLTYELQILLQASNGKNVIRGFRQKDKDEPPTALNGFLYSLLRNSKPLRRGLVQSIIKQFDDQKITLSQMLYLADNLAYFPYVVQDEPLYIMNQVDVLISVAGTNLLSNFREGLKPLPGSEFSNSNQAANPLVDEDDEDDKEALFNRLPENTTDLQNCIRSAQGCMLLLILKQHLKDIYGITDSKISRYSPSESGKIYDKAMQRRSNSIFNPKATIKLLNDELPVNRSLDVEEKKELISRYLDFKQLMLKLDPEDADGDDDDKPLVNKPVVAVTNALVNDDVPQNDHDSNTSNHINNVHNNANTLPSPHQLPSAKNEILSSPITATKTPKSKSPKKPVSKKKKKRKAIISSDEESDYSDY